jgi:inositol phosphorylceramide mannosyltransferase catalytic subunit
LMGVESRDLFWGMPYIENMLSTGCMFFSNRWMSYVRSLTGSHGKEADQVYILADGSGNMDPHMLRGAVTTPLFKHGGASSWHGWDAAAIVLIGKHYIYFLCMIAVGAVCASVLVWRLTRRSRRRRSLSPLRRSMDKSSHNEDGLIGVKEG